MGLFKQYKAIHTNTYMLKQIILPLGSAENKLFIPIIYNLQFTFYLILQNSRSVVFYYRYPNLTFNLTHLNLTLTLTPNPVWPWRWS
jgi:hypothetical protein